jgi:hypothetical protein
MTASHTRSRLPAGRGSWRAKSRSTSLTLLLAVP